MKKQDATSAGLAQLIRQQGAELGLDDESSSTIIGNLGGSVTPMCVGTPLTDDEQETDDFRVIVFGFDGSGSMEDVADELVECTNEVVVPSLCDDVLDVGLVGGIRVGGLAFSNRVWPLWGGGFQAVKLMPKLTRREYFEGSLTALNQAVLDIITMGTTYALQLSNMTGTYPEVTLAVLSDGANNQPPEDPDAICQAMQQLSPEIFTTVFYGFETYEKVDFRAIAQSLGFRDVQDIKAQPGESKEDQKRRFRNSMGVFSQKMVKRVSTSQVGSPAVAADGSTGFWK